MTAQAFRVELPCATCEGQVFSAVATVPAGDIHPVLDNPGKFAAVANVACPRCKQIIRAQLSIPAAQVQGAQDLQAPAPTMSAGEQELANDAAEQELATDVFGDYMCGSIDWGRPHPAHNITESVSMGSCPLPPATYPLQQSLGGRVIDEGLLSSLQLEVRAPVTGLGGTCLRGLHEHAVDGAGRPVRGSEILSVPARAERAPRLLPGGWCRGAHVPRHLARRPPLRGAGAMPQCRWPVVTEEGGDCTGW